MANKEQGSGGASRSGVVFLVTMVLRLVIQAIRRTSVEYSPGEQKKRDSVEMKSRREK